MRNLTKDEFEFLLKDFSCKRHPLVENFLRKSAWTFDERDVVRTYLWIGNEKPYLRGFIGQICRADGVPKEELPSLCSYRLET